MQNKITFIKSPILLKSRKSTHTHTHTHLKAAEHNNTEHLQKTKKPLRSVRAKTTSTKNKKKALFFAKNFTFGGVEKVLVTIVNGLISNGWQVSIVWNGYVDKTSMLQMISPRVKQYYALKLWHFPFFSIPCKNMPKFLRNLISKADVILNRYLSSLIPDFGSYDYIIDFRNGSSLLYNLKLEPHQKRFVWMHGAYAGFKRSRKLERHKIFCYDKIICLTEKFKQQFSLDYPSCSDKITCIYNPFITDKPVPDKQEEKECKKYQPYYLHVSRIDVDKDIQTVLAAYKKFLSKSGSNKKLVFIGDGKQYNFFKNQIQEKGYADNIIFYGRSSAPLTWMQHAEALILSSKAEGLPTVLIEGQICGTLVISSDCREGPAEILQNGKSGILFAPGDADALAEILCRIDNGMVDKQAYINNASANIYRFDVKQFIHKFSLLEK